MIDTKHNNYLLLDGRKQVSSQTYLITGNLMLTFKLWWEQCANGLVQLLGL